VQLDKEFPLNGMKVTAGAGKTTQMAVLTNPIIQHSLVICRNWNPLINDEVAKSKRLLWRDV
jgi:hypothetical protein